MNRKIYIVISAAMVALMFVGCKPTEKNYKAAYDAALARRQEAVKEQMRPATGLLSDDEPQLRVVEGDSVYVLKERLRLLDGTRLPGKWSVCVGVFKMDTNAKAAVEDMRAEGYMDAVVAKASGSRYYPVVATAGTLDSARMISKEFVARFPAYPFVGLPGAPVLIAH